MAYTKAMPDTPRTGPEAIANALRNMTVDDIERRAKEDLSTGKKTKRSGAVALLNIAKGMRRNNLTPGDYMIKAVPVIPPKYRPFAAQGESLIPGDANVLYKDLFDIKDAYEAEKDMFGDENVGQSRLAFYDAVRSVYGYGDPVKPKTKAKEVKGFLKKIVGTTAKHSFYQSKMLAKTQDNVGRSTITVNPELGTDEIEIPQEMAFTMYAPYVQRRLKQLGLSDAEALKQTKDMTDYAKHALKQVMDERPVVYSRAPAWHAHSVQAAKAKIHDGKDIKINPYVTIGLNADFDGDTINVHVPSSDAAVKEAYEKLMPSKTPFSDRQEGKIMHLPKQEQILGLYTAATAPDTEPVVFDSEQEAISAIRRGQIPLSANVEIRGQKKSASKAEEKKQEEVASLLKEMGPIRNPKSGQFMPTSRDKTVAIEKEAAGKKMISFTLVGIKQAGNLRVKTSKLWASIPLSAKAAVEEAKEAFDRGNIKPAMKLIRKYTTNTYPSHLFVVSADELRIKDYIM